MSAEFKLSEGKQDYAWMALIYGTPGSGKTFLATKAPDPLIVDMERGSLRFNCKRLVDIDDHTKLKGAINWFCRHPFKTLVLDTVDKVDEYLSAKVCAENNKKTLNDIPYGKGGDLLALEWVGFLDALAKVQKMGRNVLLLGHDSLQRVEDPTSESYDRYSFKIHKKALPVVAARMDLIAFARMETIVRERDDGRGHIAITTGKRMLHCVERPTWVAKNRYGLGETMPMDESIFEKMQ